MDFLSTMILCLVIFILQLTCIFFLGKEKIMKKILISGLVFGMLMGSTAFAYNKIDWAKMDSNNDGYVSPKEMKDHYKKAGVYK